MRYAVFTDIHANLEALEAVLAKIDELSKEKPIDQIWFLGDLVGYGPNPNECITKVRERTDVIIAGNHDWAAVGKIDLEDFSAAARISAEWTAEQLTQEHRQFLANLPERLEIDECTLVHGSPYGPLWEYLTSEILAERSFQYFNTRYCFVGHTHVPVIFQQPDTIANAPTLPLVELEQNGVAHSLTGEDEDDKDEATEVAAVQPSILTSKTAENAESAYADPDTGQLLNEAEANAMIEAHIKASEQSTAGGEAAPLEAADVPPTSNTTLENANAAETSVPAVTETDVTAAQEENINQIESAGVHNEGEIHDTSEVEDTPADEEPQELTASEASAVSDEATPEAVILNAEDRLNSEIEELLTLLGLSESMIQVTNEMFVPPEGHWDAPEEQRAIINPGGVGQPRDGDPRAAFMIYDTEEGFEFYRISYELKKTQEKIIKAALPQYLAVRLAYGR